VAMLAQPPEVLRARAEALRARAGAGELVEVTSAVGGGALPTAAPRSYALALVVSGRSPDELERALRDDDPPVVARIAGDRLLLDVRTLADAELDAVAAAVRRAAVPKT
jgi:L-seryl-tRNA(Ser) seleniumtransferase